MARDEGIRNLVEGGPEAAEDATGAAGADLVFRNGGRHDGESAQNGWSVAGVHELLKLGGREALEGVCPVVDAPGISLTPGKVGVVEVALSLAPQGGRTADDPIGLGVAAEWCLRAQDDGKCRKRI